MGFLPEQPPVKSLSCGRGRRAELVSQQLSERFVHLECLRAVLARFQYLHQIAITALAEGSEPDERAGSALGGVELPFPDPETRLRGELERAEVRALELAAALL